MSFEKNQHLFQRAEERLIRELLQSWKRRGSSLLQIGLHSYSTPDFFWDAGFDVCASDERLDVLNTSLENTGPRVEYQLTKGVCLPFEDDSFDYVFFSCFAKHNENFPFCVTPNIDIDAMKKKRSASCKNRDIIKEEAFENREVLNKRQESPEREGAGLKSGRLEEENILPEVFRIAQKGVILLFKNAFSVQSILGDTSLRLFLGQKSLPVGNRLNPYSVWRSIKKGYPQAQITSRSVYLLPKNISFISPIPFGYYTGLCITLNASVVTGLGVMSAVKKTEIGHESLVNRVP